MPKIFLKFNEQVLKEIPLDKPRFTIGRKPDNDLVIDNPAVSGHHALVFSEDGAFFIEDLESTNGTFVNEAKVQKEKLKNSDAIVVGKHVLIYQQDEIDAPPPSLKETEPDTTMILETAPQKEPLKAVPGTVKTAAVGGKTTEKAGRLTVVSGETDQKEYELTGRLTVIGAEDTATVRLTGWFAPKNAALISRRGSAYFISVQGAKKITVNEEVVQGQKQLHDADVITVAGVHFQLVLR